MPIDTINGVKLFWEIKGSKGDPLILVHGSWGDHHNWDPVATELSKSFRIITYDRRGHSQSERLDEQGYMDQDVADLIALIDFLDLSPAHIAGNSGGAAIVLKTAIQQPGLFRTLVAHEPPLFGLLNNIPEARPMLQTVNSRISAVTDLIAKGDNEEAAKLFVETIAFGPGQWEQLPLAARRTFIYNAPTFYDEIRDQEGLQIDLTGLSGFNRPVLLSSGTESPPFFLMVLDQLNKAIPGATRVSFEGAGHVPHLSDPVKYTEVVKNFCYGNEAMQL